MESPGFEPGTLRMRSGCDTTTPQPRWGGCVTAWLPLATVDDGEPDPQSEHDLLSQQLRARAVQSPARLGLAGAAVVFAPSLE